MYSASHQLGIPGEQLQPVEDIIAFSVAMCQRNTDNQQLWFSLLDKFVQLQRQLKDEKDGKAPEPAAAAAAAAGKDAKAKSAATKAAATTASTSTKPPMPQRVYRASFVCFCLLFEARHAMSPNRADAERAVQLRAHRAGQHDGVRGFSCCFASHSFSSCLRSYVALPAILRKITTDHEGDEFREFRDTIQGMLDTYNYEQNILQTANRLAWNLFHTSAV
mgnify:CR=1 FL=1